MSEKPFCPNEECESRRIARRTKKPDGGIPETKWHCRECKNEFDTPKFREPRATTGFSGVAKLLDEMEPDDL